MVKRANLDGVVSRLRRGRPRARSAAEYDSMWSQLDDFIRLHPGARHRRRIIASWLEDLDYRDCLDVGCGPGELLGLLLGQRRANEVAITGVDLSPEVIRKNRERFPGMSFAVLDIERDELDHEFDLVICSEVIEHLDDRTRTFRHLGNMLRPGGHLLVTCPTGKLFATERYFGHTSHPDIDEIRRHAAANRMDVVRVLCWGFPFYSLLKRATNVRPQMAIQGFASGDYNLPKKLISAVLYQVSFLNIPTRFGCQLFVLLEKK